jgi:excisionase family DNA binding protein
MTAEEAAAYLRLAPVTLYRLAGKGEIPGVKIGRLWRFKRSELERWFERQARLNVSDTSGRIDVARELRIVAEVQGERAAQKQPGAPAPDH